MFTALSIISCKPQVLYQGTGAFFIVKGMNRRPKMPYLSAFWRLIPSGKFELLKDSSACFVIFTLYKSIQFTHYSMPNIVNRRHFSIFCLTQSLCHSGIKFCTSHVA